MKSKALSKIDWIEHEFGIGATDVRRIVSPFLTVFDTKQVHGKTVCILDRESSGRVIEGDAFVASKPGLVCHVLTADCVPILIADKEKKVIAAVHAGWKGTALNIVGETIESMRDAFGTVPADCVAAIGPRICGECYEVGDEVVAAMKRLNLKGAWRVSDHKVDLGNACAELFESAGVRSGNIEKIPRCTSCEPRFASWRRDRAEGRQANFIIIK